MRWVALVVIAAGCAGRAAGGQTATLHAAPVAPGSAEVTAEVAANDARIQEDPGAALGAVEAAAARGPFDRPTYARLWRQRGMAHALLAYAAGAEAKDDPAVADAKKAEQAEHEAAAREAFDMLLALDPTHRLEYTESPQTTFVFQSAIAEAAKRPAPAIDVDWKRGLAVGEAVPVDVEVVADPKGFLARAELFVRRRGAEAWQATEVPLAATGSYARVVLPGALAAGARGATALELYLRAYDADGNEVLDWASAERPREVALRWDPPTPWWRKWWVWGIAASVVAAGTGVAVYAASWEPSEHVGGGVVVVDRAR
jgi:hypothetical protein